MKEQTHYQIKSFKHDGHLHRVWLKNWKVPSERLRPEHAAESMLVFVNSHTKIREADGKEWISKIPGISFFIPNTWFNVVALLEDNGVRYYCNVASPPYWYDQTLTYIDYDLDVIKLPNGHVHVVDEEEYQRHKKLYHYPSTVETKVREALAELKERLASMKPPFHDEAAEAYYQLWLRFGQEEAE